MTSIQKVLLSYEEFIRLKSFEEDNEKIHKELAELKQQLGIYFIACILLNIVNLDISKQTKFITKPNLNNFFSSEGRRH